MLLCCFVALRSLCFGVQFTANGSLCIVVPISLQRMGVKLQAEQAVAGTLRVTIHAGSMPQLAGPDFEELGSNSAKPGTIEQGGHLKFVGIMHLDYVHLHSNKCMRFHEIGPLTIHWFVVNHFRQLLCPVKGEQ